MIIVSMAKIMNNCKEPGHVILNKVEFLDKTYFLNFLYKQYSRNEVQIYHHLKQKKIEQILTP